MPRPRPTRRAPADAIPQQLEEPASEFALDPADVMLGVILLVAIPTVVYILLGAVGMPVSGKKSKGVVEQAQENEAIKNRKPPPMTVKEFKLRLTHVDRLLAQNAAEFEKRFRREEGNARRHLHWKRALDVLNHCDEVMTGLEKSLRDSPDLKLSTYEQDVTVRQGRITQEIADLMKDRPFLDH